MRVAVVFLDYAPIHAFKDQGMYMRALKLAGYDAILVTAEKPELTDYQSPDFEIISVSRKEILSGQVWDSTSADVVIGINWFSRHFLHAADNLWQRKIPLIIKADTDGYISPRLWLKESLRRSVHQSNHGHVSLIGAAKTLGRALVPAMFDRRLLTVMERSSAIIIETTAALSNVEQFMTRYHQDDLLNRFELVCNPVDPLFTAQPRQGHKRPQIALIGRWDVSQKNTRHAIRATCEFLRRQPNYTAEVVGTSTRTWEQARHHSTDIARRMTIHAKMAHQELVDLLGQSQILFSASFSEGSPLAMAEALCCGATVVGTPIPATQHFIGSNRFGTRSLGFHWRPLVEALQIEATYWEDGARDPVAISNYWRERQRYESISEQLHRLIQKCWANPLNHPTPQLVGATRNINDFATPR